MSKSVRNVQVRNHTLRTFVMNPLVRIRQKEKMAGKFASVHKQAFSYESDLTVTN